MAKIQVQGIGVYDDKTLKKKIIQLASDLQKNAKKGDWNKASENGIRALGRMWQAYQDWSRQNESITEGPDADLGKKLKQIQNQIYKLGHQYKSKANVPAMMRSFMLGVQSQLKKDKLTESVQINERITKAFMVHPTDPSQTERHWVDRFEELADGHGPIIDYGPRESDIYDWNDRRNYKKAIEEYNKYMNKIADGLNKQLNLMNNIWKVWRKISEKYRKIDKS